MLCLRHLSHKRVPLRPSAFAHVAGGPRLTLARSRFFATEQAAPLSAPATSPPSPPKKFPIPWKGLGVSAASLVLAGAVAAMWTWSSTEVNQHQTSAAEDNVASIVRAFEKGEIPTQDLPPAGIKVDRKEFVEKIKEILQPKPFEEDGKTEKRSQCYIITGETGVGKSAILFEALSELSKLPEPRGVAVYKPATMTTDASVLARAIGYDANRAYSKVTWDELKESLLLAAIAYKKKYGRPPVIVIDEADYIAEGEPKFFPRF